MDTCLNLLSLNPTSQLNSKGGESATQVEFLTPGVTIMAVGTSLLPLFFSLPVRSEEWMSRKGKKYKKMENSVDKTGVL